MKPTGRFRYWLPAVVGIAALAGTFSLWKNLVAREREVARAPTFAALSSVKEEIHSRLESRVAALNHMARRWEARKKPPRKEWESDASLFLSQFTDLRNLQWADEELKVRWVVPREQPNAPKDQIARFGEARREVLEAVQRDEQIKITQPVDLPEGSKGFLVCVPIQKENSFGGALVGVHHMGRFLDSALEAVAPTFDIALYHGDERFYQRSKGSEGGNRAQRRTNPHAAETTIRLHAADWRLEVIPGPGLYTARGTPVSTIMLIAGIVVSLLITGMLYFGYSAQNRASEFEEANRGMVAQIAERKRAEAALRDLESLVMGASHDLQEPLRKILVFGERLKALSGEQLEGDAGDCLRRMHTAASRMQKLVQDLPALSRASAQHPTFAAVGLAAVLTDVLVDLEAEIEQSGAQIHVGELPTIEADRGQIEQLLRNLIANAFKFRKPGEPPSILIESTILEADTVQGAPAEGKERLCEIRVVDKGIGFEEEHREQIFDPFKRLHGQDEYEGTGLGLTLCRTITERHGGTIRAESKPGEGSAFIVTLPVEQSPRPKIGHRRAA